MLKKIYSIIFIILLFCGSALAVDKLAKPVFNNNLNDFPTLQVANFTITKGNPNGFGESVHVNPGDTITIRVYVHNNEVNSIAENTTIKVKIDNEYEVGHTIKGVVSADNSEPVTGLVIVNANEKVKLEYVPNSTWRYRYDTENEIVDVMPDDIVTEKGLNIGNTLGCWKYQQYIIFHAKVVSEKKK